MSPAAATTPPRLRYFVTAPGARTTAGGRVLAGPEGLLHAKRMGTTTSACGLAASSWTKIWHVSFSPAAGALCSDCIIAVASDR